MHKQGLFITFEGGEGSGKSTASKEVCAWLNSFAVYEHETLAIHTREPGGTGLGSELRKFLLDPIHSVGKRAEMLLYAADRAHHLETKVHPALHKGIHVICDRYVDSTLAYQGGGQGWDIPTLLHVHRIATGDFWPDITFVLDVPVDIGLQRARERNKKENSNETKFDDLFTDFHERVRQTYLSRINSGSTHYQYIDASRPIKDVLESVIEKIKCAMYYSTKEKKSGT